MDARDAHDALVELGEIRRLARRSVRVYTFPFVLYGALALVAGGLAVMAPGCVGWWWTAATPVGGVLTWRHYRARAVATGVSRGWRRYAVAWGLALGAMVAVFAVGPAELYPTLPWAVIGLAYLGLAATGDGAQIGAVGVLLCLIGAAPLVGEPISGQADTAAGVVLLGAGSASYLATSAHPRPQRRTAGWSGR